MIQAHVFCVNVCFRLFTLCIFLCLGPNPPEGLNLPEGPNPQGGPNLQEDRNLRPGPKVGQEVLPRWTTTAR